MGGGSNCVLSHLLVKQKAMDQVSCILTTAWSTSRRSRFPVTLKKEIGIPVVAQRKRIQLRTMRFHVRSLASLSELRIGCCRELWCRSQMWLGSGITVAVVYTGSYNSDWNPSLETSMCCGRGPKKKKKRLSQVNKAMP